jgi:signal transduction histidine kinase
MTNPNETAALSSIGFESAHDYAEIYDLAALPLLSVGGDGAIRIANLAVAELLQRQRGSLLNRKLSNFVHEADRRRLSEHAISSGRGVGRACEVRMTLPSGDLVPVRLYARASLRRPGVEHVSIVDLRERELDTWEKQQLSQAAVRARAANHAKEHLIALLSHELRAKSAPLRAAALALCGAVPERGRELGAALAELESSLTTETRLLDDLLDVAASARGKLRVVKKPVDVHLLLEDCAMSLKALAERKGITLSFTPRADFASVSADRSRLKLVFSTLLTTALQVTPAGGHVGVKSWNSQDRLLVEVQDEGAGFSPEQAARLLSALDTSGDPVVDEGGAGLGLALVKALVELHGGTLTANGDGRHRGMRFVVSLSTLMTTTEAPPLANEPVRCGDSGVMPRYQATDDDQRDARRNSQP